LLCSPGWPQTHNPPALASWVLALQACTTMPSWTVHFKRWLKNCDWRSRDNWGLFLNSYWMLCVALSILHTSPHLILRQSCGASTASFFHLKKYW
jgi:hypothetical protein